MNTFYHAQARMDDLRRSAERQRLTTLAGAGRPSLNIAIYQQGRRYLGQGLIWLGSRLHGPMCQPIKPVVPCSPTVVGHTTLALSECS